MNLRDVYVVLSGSSIPSAFVLWVMRELPPSITANMRQRREEPTTLTFISDDSTALPHPQSWTAAMSLRNQVWLLPLTIRFCISGQLDAFLQIDILSNFYLF